MTRNRDIAKFLGKTEISNTTNARLLTSAETVGLDSAQVTTIAEGQGLAAYTTLDSLPVTSLTAGDQAFVESDQRLYISNGSGWYNVALLNATPTLTLDQSGTIQLNEDTLTVTVIASATDSDDNLAIITFSVESDGNMVGTGTTISQDSSVFTITADSAGGNGVSGDFTLTFKATDNINIDTEDLSFTLTFSNVVDSSAETIMLIKGIGDSGGTNSDIVYLNSSDASTNFTEDGTPYAGTFSPYRSGGYSVYFDGSGDYIDISSSSDFQFGTGAFTVECWFYAEDLDHNGGAAYPHLICINSYTNGIYLRPKYDGTLYEVYVGNTQYTFSTTIEEKVWTHVAAVRDASGNLKLFENGTQIGTTQTGVNYNISTNSSNNRIGSAIHAAGEEFKGYIRDVRVTNTAVYSSDFTAPTEALTAITGTKLLACHAPYLADGSSTGHTLTINGTPQTHPFGPYDYEPWTADDHGGSVYFDGTGDGVYTATSTDYDMSGDVTVECWVRPAAAATNNHLIWTVSNSNSDGHSAGFIRKNSTPDNMALTTLGVSQTNATGAMQNLHVWYHCAWVKEDSPGSGDEETRFYFNGKRILNQNGTSLWSAPTTPKLTIGKDYQTTNNALYGYIADFHWTNSAKYTGTTYTVPTSPVSADANTVLRMNNKTDAKIYDTAAVNTMRLLGNAETSTTTRKFTTSPSIHMLSNDYMRIDTDNYGGIGTSEPFTIEAWYYIHDITTAGLFHFTDTPGTRNYMLYLNPTSKLIWYDNPNGSTAIATQSTTTFTANAWHHVAVTRHTDNLIRIFDDGTLVATSGSAWNYALNRYLEINSYGHNYGFRGYMQDIRLTKGRARYTASFTVPTAEFEL